MILFVSWILAWLCAFDYEVFLSAKKCHLKLWIKWFRWRWCCLLPWRQKTLLKQGKHIFVSFKREKYNLTSSSLFLCLIKVFMVSLGGEHWFLCIVVVCVQVVGLHKWLICLCYSVDGKQCIWSLLLKQVLKVEHHLFVSSDSFKVWKQNSTFWTLSLSWQFPQEIYGHYV